MTIMEVARLSQAPSLALASVGVLWGGFASLLPDIKAAVSASDAGLGAALLMSSAGAMVAMALAPRLGFWLGRHRLTVLALTPAVGLLLPLFAGSVPALAIAVLVMGFSVALLDITANVVISELETRHNRHLMNFAHAMFSFAVAITAWSTGLARKAGAGPETILPILALVTLVIAGLIWASPNTRAETSAETDTASSKIPGMAVFLTGLVLFAAFLGENTTEAWSALFIERTLGGPAGEGSLGPATLGLVMGLGRLSGQLAAARLGEARLILIATVLGTAGLALLASAPTTEVALLGVAVVGLGMSVIVPSINTILGRQVPESARSQALSRAWMMGFIGFFAGPALMGGLAELYNLRVAFATVAVIVLMILPATQALARRAPREA